MADVKGPPKKLVNSLSVLLKGDVSDLNENSKE
jgi:hypothetical protein